MIKVLLQPAGSEESVEHYNNTILNPVELDRLSTFLSPTDYEILSQIYPNNLLYTWGVTPGGRDTNANKWNKIEVGDIALFFDTSGIRSKGVVTYKIRNHGLANYLWGLDTNGNTWEYIYFLDEIENRSVPYSIFNRIAEYKLNNFVRGFTVVPDEKSLKIINGLDLMSNQYLPDISKDDYNDLVEDMEDVDRRTESKVRLEQGFLRKHLFGNRLECQCGVCGITYPVSFLVAAHIKKRATCTLDEKKDVNHIVMPMCKFGCDDLYEKGYLLVEEGIYKKNERKSLSGQANTYLMNLVDRGCNYWNDNTRKYFEAHNKLFSD